MKKLEKLLWVMAVTTVLAGYQPLMAAEKSKHDDHSQHAQHNSHGESASSLKLNNGQKWSTDKALRSNMEAIHSHLNKNLDGIHNGTLKPKEYAKLGKAITVNMDDIFKNCKLPSDADAQLHVILVDVIKGKDVFLKKNSNEEYHRGAKLILTAYQSYLQYFDHGAGK